MSRCQQVGRPIARHLCRGHASPAAGGPFTTAAASRFFSSSATRRDEASSTTTTNTTPPPPPPPPSDGQLEGWELDPNLTSLSWAEKQLMRQGTPPVGSRRRRVALRAAAAARQPSVPFEQMPYQCFQEARKVLAADREEKLAQILAETRKIRALEAADAAQFRGGEGYKQRRLASLRAYVERLKILADINDPLVKRRFEDGLGDMNKPIYRYLAEQRWRGLPYRIIKQRISQFHIVPDLLPAFEPRADVQLFFRSYKVSPGDIVDSAISEVVPRLRVQAFDAGERLVSVVVVDADVPAPERDAFDRRCHYLAANLPLSPADTSLPLGKADPASQLAVPWLPAFSQKGAPYHRLAVFVLEQQPRGDGSNENARIDPAELRALYGARDGFSLRSFRDRYGLTPVGFSLFRTVWDRNTEAVMRRAGVPGADVEFKPVRLPSLKPPKKQRGWEAKRQGPKYRHLWKYTKRIASPKGKFVR